MHACKQYVFDVSGAFRQRLGMLMDKLYIPEPNLGLAHDCAYSMVSED